MEKYLNSEFWNEWVAGLVKWVIYDLTVILVILLIMFILLRINRLVFRRLNGFLVGRARKAQEDDYFEAEKRINTLSGILRGLGKILLTTIFIMIILRRLGLDIAPLLAGAGILGLAIGFGAQELVRDFISGFFMLLENQIRAGDVARINGTAGFVERIELRTTTLRDFEGVVHTFQNGKINTISNLTKEWSAAALDIGVAYKEDTDHVIRIIQEVGDDMYSDPEFRDLMLETIEIFGLDKFDDSAIVIKTRLKTKAGSQWPVAREYRKRLKKAFDREGIEIPFPHTTVYWGDEIKPDRKSVV